MTGFGEEGFGEAALGYPGYDPLYHHVNSWGKFGLRQVARGEYGLQVTALGLFEHQPVARGQFELEVTAPGEFDIETDNE